jgi:hypothetical protein
MTALVNLNAPNNPNEFSEDKISITRPDYIHDEVWSSYNSENASCNGVHHYVTFHFPSKHLRVKKKTNI